MLHFHIDQAGAVTKMVDEYADMRDADGEIRWAGRPEGDGSGWLNRNDIDTFERAAEIAASASTLLGKLMLPIDNGPHVSPRFDVIVAPKVGDEVSRGFNGDYYPAGKITAISESMRVVHTLDDRGTKRTFWRRGRTSAWIQSGGTWSLVPGVFNERNPHF